MSRLQRLIDEALAASNAEPRRIPASPAKRGPRTPKAVLLEPLRVDRTGSAGGLAPQVTRMPGANKLELGYGAVLDMQVQAGEILAWWWQSMSLRLTFLEDGTGDFYRPDFLVQMASGELQIHETKGFMQDDARTKLKVACALYPFRFVLVKLTKEHGWTRQPFIGAFP